jgi:hypothetical protein
MNNLLRAGFRRLLLSKIFWLGIIVMFSLGIYLPWLLWHSQRTWGDVVFVEPALFAFTTVIIVASSVFVSLYIGTEYSDGTIRNKVIIAHKRSSIYLANLWLSFIGSAIMCLIYLVTVIPVASLLLDFSQVDILLVSKLLLSGFIMVLAISGVNTFISMTIQNKAYAAVVSILNGFLMLFLGIFTDTRLAEPRYLTYMLSIMEDADIYITMEMLSSEPNPHYISGITRQIYQAIVDITPGGQGIQISSMNVDNPWVLMMYSILVTVIITSVGLLIFKKRDIK